MDFDVVIVGGGPAGLSAGYFLSKYGFETLILERGNRLGAKNVFGGRIYTYPLDKYFGGWRDEAPIERWVEYEKIILLCEEDSLELSYRHNSKDMYKSFTTFLSKFIEWMGALVESEGGVIATGVKADKVIFKDGYVSGVEASGDIIEAKYTIFAEGVNSILVEKYGLKKKPSYKGYAVGVKEVFKLDKSVINRIFGVNDSGVAAYILGGPLKGVVGGGFIYTMDEYITLGTVVHLDEAYRGVYIRDLIEDFKSHPTFEKIFKEATLVEYSARIVSEAGIEGIIDKPYGDGYVIVGDSAGFILNTGFTVRGVDYAILSGKYAADAIKYAHENGSRGKDHLSRYQKLIYDSPIYRGLHRFRNISKVLSDPFVYRHIPPILCSTLKGVYTVDDQPNKLYDSLKSSIQSEANLLYLIYKLIVLGRLL